jgi:hypothetical protein
LEASGKASFTSKGEDFADIEHFVFLRPADRRNALRLQQVTGRLWMVKTNGHRGGFEYRDRLSQA